MKAVLASHNKKKIVEMERLLKLRLPDITLVSPEDVGIEGEAVESGMTFEENALLKAEYCAIPGYYSFADDSGLEVDALGGEPGVYSARYSGEHGDDKANNRLVLEKLVGVPEEKRTARFVAAIACVFPSGESFTVRGTVEGRILDSEIGENGFGYDPLFYSFEAGCSFGVYPPEKKNMISHRGRALRLLCDELVKRLGDKNADK